MLRLLSVVTMLLWRPGSLGGQEFRGCSPFPPDIDLDTFKYTLVHDYGNGHGQHLIDVALPRGGAKNWLINISFNQHTCITAAWCDPAVPTPDGVHCVEVESTSGFSHFLYGYHNEDGFPLGHVVRIRLNTFQMNRGKLGPPFFINLAGDNTAYVSQTDTPPANETKFCEECDGGYALKADRCDQFVRCSSSMPMTVDCPKDTYFNQVIKTCDAKKRSGCATPAERRVSCGTVGNCPITNFFNIVFFGFFCGE